MKITTRYRSVSTWRLAGVVASIAVCACADREPERTADSAPAPPALARDTAAPFQTDSLAYHLTWRDDRYEGSASVLFRNQTADTAYFVNCNGATGFQLEREEAGKWVAVWAPPQNQCLSAPIVVPPGDSLRRTTILLDGYQPDTPGARPLSADSSLHRLVWTAMVHHYARRPPPFGAEVPLVQRVSNRFFLFTTPR